MRVEVDVRGIVPNSPYGLCGRKTTQTITFEKERTAEAGNRTDVRPLTRLIPYRYVEPAHWHLGLNKNLFKTK